MPIQHRGLLNVVDCLSIEGIYHYVDSYKKISDTRPLTHKEKTEIQLLQFKLAELNKICYNILKENNKKEVK